MSVAIIIPARYASSRLPGKPLLRETGKYLVQHVYEQACLAKADRVIVATDDERILQAVRGFGGEAALTSAEHPSGTDRVAEVARGLCADIIINVQGDEPLLPPDSLDLLVDLLHFDQQADMATLAVPIKTVEQWRDPNCVKLVRDDRGRALYFSRSPIPYVRDGEPDFHAQPARFFQHLGLYGYRREFLLDLAQEAPCVLEELEKLEQLRVLALGKKIQVGIVEHASRGVDTPEDYRRFVETWKQIGVQAAA